MNEKLGLIVNSQEYYFQKLEDAFKKFDDYKISNNQIDILIDKVSKFYDNNKSKNNERKVDNSEKDRLIKDK